MLFKQGEKAQGLWLIMNGKVKVFKTVTIMKVVKPGPGGRSASVGVKPRPTEDQKDEGPIHKMNSEITFKKRSSKTGESISQSIKPDKNSRQNEEEFSSSKSKTEPSKIKSSSQSKFRISHKTPSRSRSLSKPNTLGSSNTEATPAASKKPSVPKFDPKKVAVPAQVSIDDYGISQVT